MGTVLKSAVAVPFHLERAYSNRPTVARVRPAMNTQNQVFYGVSLSDQY